MTTERERLIVVGNGAKDSWDDALAALAEDYELSLISADYPTWEAAHVDKHRVADTAKYGALFEAVCDLVGEVAFAGLLVVDAASIPRLAVVAGKLQLRFTSPDTAQLCADETTLHRRLFEGGVAVEKGEPDKIVHCVVQDGVVTPLGGEFDALVVDVHRIVGADWGVTTTRLRTAGAAPRVVGFDPWISERPGDTAARAALARIAADIAFEREPDSTDLARLAGESFPAQR